MAVTRWLRRFAAAAPVPTFLLQGVAAGPPGDAEALRLDPRLAIVDSPRHATVLLVAGDLPGPLQRPAALAHDALPHPRATVWWGEHRSDAVPAVPVTRRVAAAADVVSVAQAAHRSLLVEGGPSEAAWLTDSTRQPWRGVGPHGHGGSGMTGGTPYGRPLADRADDLRDGLKLDLLPVTVGPFFPSFPTGLTLRVGLQGDLVQDVEVLPNPFLTGSTLPAPARGEVFWRAATEPVRVAELEVARLRSHLSWLAGGLRLVGLRALGQRALALAVAEPERVIAHARAIATLVERLQVTRAVPPAGAVTAAGEGDGGLGLVARAAGVTQDARADDDAYLALGFEPVVQKTGDARARWDQHLAEIRQSAHLAARAGQRMREPGPALEAPAPPAARLLPLLPGLLVGQEWGDAVRIVASLHLDLRTAARADAVKA